MKWKSANCGCPFSKTKEQKTTATSSDLRSFLPKTVEIANDHELGTMSSVLSQITSALNTKTISSHPVTTSRREEGINNQTSTRVFQLPIDSRSASSCLISPHFAASAVEVGCGAASFLTTERTGAVLMPRLMTPNGGHAYYYPSSCSIVTGPSVGISGLVTTWSGTFRSHASCCMLSSTLQVSSPWVPSGWNLRGISTSCHPSVSLSSIQTFPCFSWATQSIQQR